MKKWMAMALALCMLCGMVNVTHAEASKFQTISTSFADFDIPAGVEYEIINSSDDRFVIEWVCEGAYDISITVSTRDAEYYWYQDDPQMAFFQEGMHYFWIPQDDYQYLYDWKMLNKQPVIAAADRGASFRDDYAFYHHYGPFGIQVAVCFWDKQPMEAAIEMAKPILKSVRNPGEPSPVKPANVKPANVKQENMKPDAAPVGKQPLTIGRASFEVDADLEIMQMGDYQWMLMNDQYAVVFTYDDWENDDIDFTNGDMQIDACYILYYLGSGDQQTAESVCNLAQRKDIGMPGGDDVLHLTLGGVGMLSHYYPNMGFMMMGQCKDGSLSDEEILAMLEEIALSFRVDGMTADEMTAHKAQAEADLAVAIAAQEEAERLAQEEAARKAAEEAARKRVYITASGGCNIRSGPDASYAKISYGYTGDSFPYLGTEGNWHKIEVNGQTGYVSKGMCEVR